MSRKVVIVVPGVPPSLNEWMRWHPYARYQRSQEWKQKVAWVCAAGQVKSFVRPVTITLTYFFPDRRRRDFDNYSGKFILDGLRPQVIPDDCSEVVKELVIRFAHDPKDPRVEVIIERAA